jgi:hypothetical protein
MFAFLKQYWERGSSEEIASLLGSMSLLADGGSADPAQLSDWNKAVELALAGEVDAQMHLSK